MATDAGCGTDALVTVGDAAGAEAGMRAVLATEVMRYWEYEMSWEMLDRHVRPSAARETAPTSATAARESAPASAATAR